MGEQAVKVAQDYAWEKIANRLLDLYNNTLGTPASNQASNGAGM